MKFHDGEAFNAAAVCANYDHWFNWKGTYQSSAVSYYWQTIMGGFAKNEDAETPKANYKSCTAKDENTAVIEVNEPSANLPGGFSLQALAIHSPKALKEYEKQDATAKGDAITYPKYSQEAGTVAGTGPYKFVKWDKGEQGSHPGALRRLLGRQGQDQEPGLPDDLHRGRPPAGAAGR